MLAMKFSFTVLMAGRISNEKEVNKKKKKRSKGSWMRAKPGGFIVSN
jgi:hypothetical protein